VGGKPGVTPDPGKGLRPLHSCFLLQLLIVDERTSVADIRPLLVTGYPRLQPILERSLCAVNRGYVSAETVLHEGDELVFIPPMGGGNLQE